MSKIRENKDGELVSFDTEGNPIAISKDVLVSIGARQEPFDLDEVNQKKLILSDEFLRFSNNEIHAFVEGKRVAIIGGAHSALSCLDNIRSINQQVPISLLHRSDFKLYFENEDEARKANYPYCKSDLDSGKIHRFKGVRGDAKTRYERIRNKEDPNSKIIKYSGSFTEICQYLDQADIVIQATGYIPKTIPVFNNKGRLVNQSPVDTKEEFKPLELGNGRVFYNGIAITPRDGVNLFQGEFSAKILSQLSS